MQSKLASLFPYRRSYSERTIVENDDLSNSNSNSAIISNNSAIITNNSPPIANSSSIIAISNSNSNSNRSPILSRKYRQNLLVQVSDETRPPVSDDVVKESDYPEPGYDAGDYHHIERIALKVSFREQELIEYLSSNFTTTTNLDLLREKYLLLADKAVRENKIYQILIKEKQLTQTGFFLAVQVCQSYLEYDRAVYLTLTADRGHSLRALAVKKLMQSKLEPNQSKLNHSSSSLYASPSRNLRFSTQNVYNINKLIDFDKNYMIEERVIRISSNPRFNRVVPKVEAGMILCICENSPSDRVMVKFDPQATTEYLVDEIIVALKINKKNIFLNLGPKLFYLKPHQTLYEQQIYPETVIFF